jgi:hypothetical protein
LAGSVRHFEPHVQSEMWKSDCLAVVRNECRGAKDHSHFQTSEENLYLVEREKKKKKKNFSL